MQVKLSVVISVLALGVALGATISSATAEESGEWACYIGDKLPDIKAAGEWRGAQKVSQGLNLAAKHVERGTVITVPYPVKMGMGSQVSAPLLCVKN